MTKNATYCDKHVSSRKCIFFVVTSDLGLFLGVSVFIGFFASVSREDGPRGEHNTLGHAWGPGGLCPPHGSFGPPTKLLVPLLFQKKSSKSFVAFGEL